MHFHYRHLHGNTYDVFVGNGWDNWSRIRVGRDYSSVIAGYRIPAGLLRDITATINT